MTRQQMKRRESLAARTAPLERIVRLVGYPTFQVVPDAQQDDGGYWLVRVALKTVSCAVPVHSETGLPSAQPTVRASAHRGHLAQHPGPSALLALPGSMHHLKVRSHAQAAINI